MAIVDGHEVYTLTSALLIPAVRVLSSTIHSDSGTRKLAGSGGRGYNNELWMCVRERKRQRERRQLVI